MPLPQPTIIPRPGDLPGAGIYHGIVTVTAPDYTTIEVIAAPIGSNNTQVNMRAGFSVDGSLPVASGAYSGYQVGQIIQFEVYSPHRIATAGVPARPYTLRMVIEVQDVAAPANTILSYFSILFPSVPYGVTGVVPVVYLQGQAITASQDPAHPPVTTVILGVTKTITTYLMSISVPDPVNFQVVGNIFGPAFTANPDFVRFNLATSTTSQPADPSSGPTFQGDVPVNGNIPILPVQNGFAFRGGAASKTLYVALTAVDGNDNSNVMITRFQLTVTSAPTLASLANYVKVNGKITLVSALPTISGPFGPISTFTAGDNDTVEVLIQPQGAPGTQAVLRELHLADGISFPSFPSFASITSYDPASGLQLYSDNSYIAGVFNIDNYVAVVPAKSGLAFRELSGGGALAFQADAASTVNISNTVTTAFRIKAIAPIVINDIHFFYINSRNPTTILPILGSGHIDVNNPSPGITGLGTQLSPYVMQVDEPEQLIVYAIGTFPTGTGQAYFQTAYAYDTTTVDPTTDLLPAAPADWKRGYGPNQGALTFPHPVPPGTTTPNVPLTGAQIILASGGTPIGGIGPFPGVSNPIQLYAKATGVGSAENVVIRSIWLIIRDSAVSYP